MRIFFGPDFPNQQDYSIIAMIHYLGYSAVRSADEAFDIGYLWQDKTHVKPPKSLIEVAKDKPVLNLKCTDISKQTVNRIWQSVCGYSSEIDPLKHQGKAIKKFDSNGQGGGEIINCPISQIDYDNNFIYQLYIETNPAGPQLEYRVPVVMACIPCAFEVMKDDPESVEGKRIKNQYKHSIIPKETNSIFTETEQGLIIDFCEKIGFDIGELDILRCTNTQRLYIIDVNTTPTYFNMFNRYWQPSDKRSAIASVAECWDKKLKERLNLRTLHNE